MKSYKLTRKKFLDVAKLSLAFLLVSCQNISKRISLGFQKRIIPESLIETIPNGWIKRNLNKSQNKVNLNFKEFDLVLLNDGWLNGVNLTDFINIDKSLLEKIDDRSKTFLNSWDINDRNKLFPIGIIPYAVIVKNNRKIKLDNNKSWDFLLSDNFKGRIILPDSPRIVISLANKISRKNSLKALLNQNYIYDDKNAIDWLINTDAVIAVMPLTQCIKFLKIDSRLSIIFPSKGVPLMWNFLLIKSKINQNQLREWIKVIENKNTIRKLSSQGWYIPFKNDIVHEEYSRLFISDELNNNPSIECWNNSWSMPPLTQSDKITLENYWNQSLTP